MNNLVYDKGVFFFSEWMVNSIICGITTTSFLGLNTGDDFSRLACELDITYSGFAYLRQTHSKNVIYCDRDSYGIFRGDGLLTDRKGLALIVRTADCFPVFIFNRCSKQVGLLHIGWRPAFLGIVSEFVQVVRTMGRFLPKDTLVFIGPGLQECCFEVQEEFLNFFKFRTWVKRQKTGLFFNLAGFITESFLDLGVPENNIKTCGLCTMCMPAYFYSYRRNKTSFRNISFILRT